MKEKLVCVVLSMVLIFSFSACGANPAFSAPATPEPINWPVREIRLIVPFAPGGSTDVVGRIVAEHMSQNLGVPVIVENIPGAGCVIGFNELFTSPADGYTVAICSSQASPWSIEALSPATPPFRADDFVSVGSVTGLGGTAGFVSKRGRWPDFMTFINEVRANPGRIKLGLQGPGQPTDAQVWELEKVAGLDFRIVYYAGSADIQTDLLTGDLDVGRLSANRQDFVENENFSILAIWGKEIPAEYPVQGLPMLAGYAEELGFNYEETIYVKEDFLAQDIIVRVDTDPAIFARLEKCIEDVVNSQAYKDAVITSAWPYHANSADATAAYRHSRDILLAFLNSPDYVEFLSKVQ